MYVQIFFFNLSKSNRRRRVPYPCVVRGAIRVRRTDILRNGRVEIFSKILTWRSVLRLFAAPPSQKFQRISSLKPYKSNYKKTGGGPPHHP